MNDGTYRLIAGLFDAFLWGGELTGVEHLPDEGPIVFVANHLDALGPIAVIASLPVRVHPWVIVDMLDRELAPVYLNQDLVEPQLGLRPPLSLWFSRLISKISVPLLTSAGCVPVYRGENLLETYRLSVELLAGGGSLLIFPEDPTRTRDLESLMTPFKRGFTRLGEQYYVRTGRPLQFCPLAVHADSSRVQVGAPVKYNFLNAPRNERLRLKSVLEANIRRMYIDMSMSQYPGIPLHR
jgi:1-acyl-sn-glycerol-3-phosphate acyltransferase